VNRQKGGIRVKKGSITLENGNKVLIEFFDKEAPGTVQNFEKLANEGFYNGLAFHRVIPDFVAQGGCPRGNGTGGPGYTIKCETKGNPHIHQKGALSMAHAGKDTGGSQFFICFDAFPHLDGKHTVFGRVTEGMEHVDAVKQGDKMKEVKVWEE
jgi:peptidyl-prolyl cis-trans isomerase B (cyclophilin B)